MIIIIYYSYQRNRKIEVYQIYQEDIGYFYRLEYAVKNFHFGKNQFKQLDIIAKRILLDSLRNGYIKNGHSGVLITFTNGAYFTLTPEYKGLDFTVDWYDAAKFNIIAFYRWNLATGKNINKEYFKETGLWVAVSTTSEKGRTSTIAQVKLNQSKYDTAKKILEGDGFNADEQAAYLRTAETIAALEKMDCSEFVGRYLNSLGVKEQNTSLATSDNSLQNFFKKQVEQNVFEEINNFDELKRGDIIVWGGHTCVVTEYYTWYCKEGDGKPSIDIIEAVKENFTGCDQEKKYYEKVKIGRKPKYYFEGKATNKYEDKQKNIKYYRIK